ncbi:hypothetical protein BPLS_P4137 [Bathymodiolus platifrons methanotrophic gill symbiont]|nr:hypothetical protein [Bathymodiolus platifrons methanotrophic gill symbiont]TXL18266.1 hypothetical protein BMR03_15840 [Methylococcaceae bacterium HT2]GFO76392.1 hypothetical protein BPLS_P4137 [Bathymodiolus platifrons methanotrophic gill symbiont]
MTISSVLFFVVVFFIQNEINPLASTFGDFYWITYLFYLSMPFLITFSSLYLCKYLSQAKINKVCSIEAANNDFLANYLGFFFVALSVKGTATFWTVFGMTILFTLVSRVSYFNPVLLVFGFNFYYVVTGENVKVMLISKKKLKSPKSFETLCVRRINDYTFIEIQDDD